MQSSIRHYLLQNQRGDVIGSIRSTDKLREGARYSAYGVPYAVPTHDFDADGDADQADEDFFDDIYDNGPYNVRADFDLDGVINIVDSILKLRSQSQYLAIDRGELSSTGNEMGLAGYVHDGVIVETAHVRNRVLFGAMGRWGLRDSAGIVDDEMNLYEYVDSQPTTLIEAIFELSKCSRMNLSLCSRQSGGGECKDMCDAKPSFWGETDCATGQCCVCDTNQDNALPATNDSEKCAAMITQNCITMHEMDHLRDNCAGEGPCVEMPYVADTIRCLEGRKNIQCQGDEACRTRVFEIQEGLFDTYATLRKKCFDLEGEFIKKITNPDIGILRPL